jgi:type IV pilus assembly protein PilN
MIRINLLGTDRHKKASALAVDAGRALTIACSLVLVVTAAVLGWWYWSLAQASAQVDTEIVGAQQEVARLQSVLVEVQRAEQRRQQVQQRVSLIEQLQKGQGTPVQLLDQVSRSLPDMLWLTSMTQQNNEVSIEGRSTTLISVSDFVGNLGNSPVLQKPIEIVSSQVETVQAGSSAAPGQPAGVDLIRFSIKAQLAQGAAPAAPPAGRGGTPSPAVAGRGRR